MPHNEHDFLSYLIVLLEDKSGWIWYPASALHWHSNPVTTLRERESYLSLFEHHPILASFVQLCNETFFLFLRRVVFTREKFFFERISEIKVNGLKKVMKDKRNIRNYVKAKSKKENLCEKKSCITKTNWISLNSLSTPF